MKPEIRQRILEICAEFGEDMNSPACERLRQHAQESPDCAAFVDSMQKANTLPTAMMQTNWGNLTVSERADKMVELAKVHLQSAESRASALKTFYATLTPAQQKIFDEYNRGTGRMGHGHMGPGQMPMSPMGGYGPSGNR